VGKPVALVWGEAIARSERRRIGSLSEGFIFVADGLSEPRIECESCHQIVGDLDGLIAGWECPDFLKTQSS